MEALEGRSLGAIIAEDGPLEVPRALALLEQICRALGAAHARGVVHRDVKPDNVFVVRRPDGSERAKVIDFGISQVASDGARGGRLTQAGAIIGTPEYMAPEQAAGDAVDHRADLYALGVLAYEMLTGTLPIVATTPIATLVAHQTRTPDAPSRRRPGIPAEVDALVLHALAKRPEDRPASMEALADAVAALRGAVATVVEKAPAVARVTASRTIALPGRGRGRGRRPAAIAVGVAVAASAAVAWWAAAPPTTATTTTTTANPTATATATSTGAESPSAPSPQPSPPALAGGEGDEARASTVAVPSPPKRPSRARRAAKDSHHEDPYAVERLKPDPF
jgi:serine/threonine-protein kinase